MEAATVLVAPAAAVEAATVLVAPAAAVETAKLLVLKACGGGGRRAAGAPGLRRWRPPNRWCSKPAAVEAATVLVAPTAAVETAELLLAPAEPTEAAELLWPRASHREHCP